MTKDLLDYLRELVVNGETSDKNLIALIYFLYPEIAEKSPNKEEIDKLIESLKGKAKQYFRYGREGNEVVIDIL
jgi:hypothetical protein